MKFPIIITEQDFKEHFKSDIWTDSARQICRRHTISCASLKRSENGEHIVFLVDDTIVIKIFAPFRNGFEREKTALEFAQNKTSLRIPEIIETGNFENFNYLITSQLPGKLMKREIWLTLSENEQISVMTELAVCLRELHSHNADLFDFDWQKFIEIQAKLTIQRQIKAKVNSEIIEKLPEYIETNLKLLPKDCRKVFLHGDVHFGNLRLHKSNGKWQISGLFDFADSLCGFHEFDFVAVGLLMIQGQAKIQREFFKLYGYKESELNESFRKRLMLLTILYECSDLRRYALRLKPEAVDFSLDELEKAIWNFTE